MEDILVVGCLGGRHHRDEEDGSDQVPPDAVILVNGLGVVDAAVQGGDVKLGEANQGLDE